MVEDTFARFDTIYERDRRQTDGHRTSHDSRGSAMRSVAWQKPAKLCTEQKQSKTIERRPNGPCLMIESLFTIY